MISSIKVLNIIESRIIISNGNILLVNIKVLNIIESGLIISNGNILLINIQLWKGTIMHG